jgi:CARDB/Bacterial pre-peptidase C-terminal domain
VISLANPPPRVSPGTSFHASDTTANVGSGRAGASVTGYYLVSSEGKQTALLGRRNVPALTSGGVSSAGASVHVPASLPHGLYALRACADVLHKVNETKEADNCKTTSKKVDIAPPPRPVIQGTIPASGAADTTPEVFGHAAAGLTVRVFINGSCTGSPAATGSAATFANPGIQVTVFDETLTSLSAQAVDAAHKVSPCSASVTYMDNSPEEQEPNGTPASANDITGDPTIFGSIDPAGDTEYFKVTIPSGTTAITATTADTADTTHRCENGTLDSDIAIFPSFGTALASNDDISQTNTCSSATASGLSPGNYFIQVTAGSANPNSTFPYRLNISTS